MGDRSREGMELDEDDAVAVPIEPADDERAIVTARGLSSRWARAARVAVAAALGVLVAAAVLLPLAHVLGH